MTRPHDDFSDLVAKGRALQPRKAGLNDIGKFLNGGAQDQAIVELECAVSIKATAVAWLWKDWLARGKMHILAGTHGVGKSTIAFKIAAAVSSGGKFPDGARAEQGTVIIWSHGR